ncbi:MAG TPA: hypothetical protein VF086_02695 [Propionibacteriaceae bacterium]
MTPDAAHAAATAASRSAHDRTVPVRVPNALFARHLELFRIEPGVALQRAARSPPGTGRPGLGVRAPGELGRLALTFDHMATDLTRAQQTRRQQLAAGSMAARRIDGPHQPATGRWGQAMRLETPHCSVNIWLCAR